MVICSQLPDNDNTSVTNMAEYLAAEVIRGHFLSTPLVWIEHYPEQKERSKSIRWCGSLARILKRYAWEIYGATALDRRGGYR